MSPLVFSTALLCAAVMGCAIQRGATCTVAAVDELLTQRRTARLRAMLEAGLWVLGGLLLLPLLQAMPRMPAAYAVGIGTVLGGVLLGLGAFINRACVFGALARLGSGEWAYLVTPLGFFIGCTAFQVLGWMAAARVQQASPVLQASMLWLWPVLALMALRLAALLKPRPEWVQSTWSPHAATLVIGLTFFVMFALAGAWAYTDVLAELAAAPKSGMRPALLERLLLMAALFGGAVLGGWTAGRFKSVPLSAGRLARCFAGGVLMGMGSALIPGGNDGLVLMGLPLLWPYAWVAFFSMCAAIALAITARGRWPAALSWA